MPETALKPGVSRARVLLAEDHHGVAVLLRALLVQEFDVVGVVGDGFAMVDAAWELEPDVIVADITMPGMDGLAAARAIRRQRPDARIVFVSIHDEPALVRRAFQAGAAGYVLKVSASEALIPAVHAALRSERITPGERAGCGQSGGSPGCDTGSRGPASFASDPYSLSPSEHAGQIKGITTGGE